MVLVFDVPSDFVVKVAFAQFTSFAFTVQALSVHS